MGLSQCQDWTGMENNIDIDTHTHISMPACNLARIMLLSLFISVCPPLGIPLRLETDPISLMDWLMAHSVTQCPYSKQNWAKSPGFGSLLKPGHGILGQRTLHTSLHTGPNLAGFGQISNSVNIPALRPPNNSSILHYIWGFSSYY